MINHKILLPLSFLFLIYVSVITSCGPKKPSTPQSFNSENPTVVEGKTLVTETEEFMVRLKSAYDSLKVVDEYNSLKAINNYNIIEENLGHLHQMLDSIQLKPYTKTELEDQVIGLKAQISYMHTLMAAGKAILSGDSQSFGTWADDKKGKK